MSLRLIAKLRALPSSRLLAGALLAVLLGGLLAKIAAPLWLATAGVFLASAGAATLIAAAGYRRASDDPGRRIALAGVLFVPALFVGGFLWFHGSTVEATAKEIVPVPGTPLRLSGAVSDVGSDGRDRNSLLEGTFTVMQIAESGASVATEANTPSRVFRIQLPVKPSECSWLRARFGGGCSGPGAQTLGGFTTFEILSLRRPLPLTAEIRPFGASVLELIETTSQAQQGVPTEWNLASYGPRTDIALHCVDGTPLELKTPFAAARVRCTLGASTYELTVQTAGKRPAGLYLNELSEFAAHVSARTARATVADAELSVDGEEKALPSRPAAIYMRAAQDHTVELAIEQSLGSDLNHVSLSATGVSTVRASQRELIPNWIERHSDFIYFVLGILVASLVPTLFDLTLSRLKR